MKSNEITVYWSFNGKYQIKAEKPVPVIQNYFKDKSREDYDYIRCPSFHEYYKNTYGIKSIFDYELTFDGDLASSDMHDQNFYEEFVYIRSYPSKLTSFSMFYTFISENKDLEMEYLPPMMENNSFNNSAKLIPGTMNIGKYVRFVDCAFHVRDNTVSIKEDDIYAYLKFKTDKKINFQRFYCTPEIEETIKGQKIVEYRAKNFKPLNWFYKKQNALRTKERTMKLIKENLV